MRSRDKLLLLPMVLLLVALVIFYPAFKGLPIFGFLRTPSKPGGAKSEVKIWANTRSGFYYCPDSKLYGSLKPGVYLAQGEALQRGYKPASKETCR